MTASTLPVLANTTKLGGRTLIVGSTGFIGRFIAEACLESGRPTYVLVRSRSSAFSTKTQIIHTLQNKGATIIIVRPLSF